MTVGFGRVRVPTWGFKSQSEVHGLTATHGNEPPRPHSLGGSQELSPSSSPSSLSSSGQGEPTGDKARVYRAVTSTWCVAVRPSHGARSNLVTWGLLRLGQFIYQGQGRWTQDCQPPPRQPDELPAATPSPSSCSSLLAQLAFPESWPRAKARAGSQRDEDVRTEAGRTSTPRPPPPANTYTRVAALFLKPSLECCAF